MKNKIVRRLLTLSLCTALAFGLMACGKKDNSAEDNNDQGTVQEDQTPEDVTPDETPDAGVEDDTEQPVEDVGEGISPLSEEMDQLMANVPDLPALGEVILEEENFEYYAFIPYIEGAEALASDALISAIPHSAVLIRLPEGADAADLAAQIEANANPGKWVCVMADKVAVLHNDNTILLVMSSEDAIEAITANFNALYAE